MFFKVEFSYCLLIWVRHSRALNKKINSIHEQDSKTVYNTHESKDI